MRTNQGYVSFLSPVKSRISESRAPECGSGPSCPLEGSPPASRKPQPSPSRFPPPPLALFAMLQECGGGGGQKEGRALRAAGRARPRSGVTRHYSKGPVAVVAQVSGSLFEEESKRRGRKNGVRNRLCIGNVVSILTIHIGSCLLKQAALTRQ